MKGIDRREFIISGGIAAGLTATSQRVWTKGVPRLDVTGLTVDYIAQPLGLDNPSPRLSWRIESQKRSTWQSAYRILVASSERLILAERGDLWDSGRVRSRTSIGVLYRGLKLRSRQRCWWRVQVWDDRGEASNFSTSSWWEMGLLEPKDWTARWLAVESKLCKADREAGLHWIWDASSAWTKRALRFRFTFELPVPATAGELIAAVNDWWFFTQITRIWLDGEPIAGLGRWVESTESGSSEAAEFASLSRQRLFLAPLEAGRHVLAFEINTGDLWPSLTAEPVVPGFGFLLRVSLQTGEVLRLVSGSNCRTSLADEPNWYRPDYDDTGWSSAHQAAIDGYQPWPPQPAMHLRREFVIEKPVAHARLYATALGIYEARLNGKRVGDAYLMPEPTQYAERLLYQIFDVSSLLRSGPNSIGFTVGDGWYASFDGRFAWAPPPRRLLGQLEISFSDGSRQVVGTDDGWRMASSPILESEIKSGEVYDARLEQTGWDTIGFDEANWQSAQPCEAPRCRLVAQTSPPVRIMRIFKPKSITTPKPDIHVVDFGENFSGWCRLRMTGPRGTEVIMKSAELLKSSGEVEQASPIGDPMWKPRTDRFVLKGDPAGEILEPHFTYRGFRYVEISGLNTRPSPESLDGVFVHTDLRTTGRIRSSVMLLEQFSRASLQTQRTNFVAIPTDNALREMRSYPNDSAGVIWDSATYNADVCSFTARVMDNLRDDQGSDGAFPLVTPEPRHNNAWYKVSGSPPAWGDGGIILPWTAWQRYGDVSIIEKNWEAMNRHVQFILDHNPDLIWRHKRSNDFGDWMEGSVLDPKENIPSTPKDLLGTAYFAHSSDLLAQMAEATSRTSEGQRLRSLFMRICNAFNKSFVHTDGTIGSGSQGGYVLALKFNLIPEEFRSTAAKHLVDDLESRGRLTTGTVTTQFLLDVLVQSGYTKLAYDLLLKTDYPSWGYMMKQGSTTFWERWDGNSARNQMQFGSIGGFLFRRLAGIEGGSPGFEKCIIRPVLDARVTRGGGDYDSIMGMISTDWSQNSNGDLSLDVNIPANVSARVHLPASRRAVIKESRRAVTGRDDIRMIERSDNEAVIEVGSGSYLFLVGGWRDCDHCS